MNANNQTKSNKMKKSHIEFHKSQLNFEYQRLKIYVVMIRLEGLQCRVVCQTNYRGETLRTNNVQQCRTISLNTAKFYCEDFIEQLEQEGII